MPILSHSYTKKSSFLVLFSISAIFIDVVANKWFLNAGGDRQNYQNVLLMAQSWRNCGQTSNSAFSAFSEFFYPAQKDFVSLSE
ncbi:MAG: hypothetical protein HC799_12700 [Limnothrix sp. RL_2_0]|nr:hypothetical protein [Limnothrix sp. RL_2_0]